MKKILALLLVAVMCFAMIAACDDAEPPPPPDVPDAPGGNDNPGGTDSGELSRKELAELYGLPWFDEMESWAPITLTYFDRNPANTPADTNPIINVIEQITNVKIVWQMNTGDLATAMSTMHQSEDLPDIAFFGGAVETAIETGYYIPLEDLIEEYAPNLREHYDPWWELMKNNILGDGHIYTLEIWGTRKGEETETFWSNQTAFWIQKDVLDYFGRPPADLDEYFDFLREYAEVFPDIDGVPTKPFLIRNVNDANGRFSLGNGGLFLGGNSNQSDFALNTAGSHEDAPISPDAHERWVNEYNYRWWKKLNEEYHKGTFTEETFTLDNDQYLAEIASGAVLGINDQAWHGVNNATDPFLAEGRPERGYMPLGLTFDGLQPNYLDKEDESTFSGNNGVNISVSNKEPIRTIQYMDYLILPEVQRFLYWGIEGQDYFYNDDGVIERFPEARVQQADTQWTLDNLGRFMLNAFPKIQGRYPDGNVTDTNGSWIEYWAGLPDYDRELFEKLGIDRQVAFWGEPQKRPVYFPYWSMGTPPVGTAGQLATQAINDIRLTIAPMIIVDEDKFDAAFDEFKAAILAVDVEELNEFFATEAQKRVDAAGG